MAKRYRYYYYDEVNDDFAGHGFSEDPIPDDYEYIPKNPAFTFFRYGIYYGFLWLIWLVCVFPVRQKNRKVFKKRRDRSKGFFIYGNHTRFRLDAGAPPSAVFPTPGYIIVSPQTVNIKGISLLVRLLGAIPVPSSQKTYRNFLKALHTFYDKGCAVTIYPEAHIWPDYHMIRDFKSVSFSYPVELNAPCFTQTTVYLKKRNGRTKPMIIYDGPFYPDLSLGRAKAKEDLRERIRNQMLTRCEEYNSSPNPYRQYIKADSPKEVRTEIDYR